MADGQLQYTISNDVSYNAMSVMLKAQLVYKQKSHVNAWTLALALMPTPTR